MTEPVPIESQGIRVSRSEIIAELDEEVLGRLQEHYGKSLRGIGVIALTRFGESTPDSVADDMSSFDTLGQELEDGVARIHAAQNNAADRIQGPFIA